MSSGGFDSRAWTGSEPEPARLDRRRARSAFAEAGGSAALRPQRACGYLVAAGFLLLLALALLQPSTLDPWPIPTSALDRFHEAWTVSGPGTLLLSAPWTTSGAAIRACVLGIALLASLCGIVLAWRARRALARGFEAAEGPARDAVFVTHRVDLLAPVSAFCVLAGSAKNPEFSLPSLLLMGLLALFTARAMTAVAERRFAELGARANRASRWDLAALGLSFGAVSTTLAHLLSSG